MFGWEVFTTFYLPDWMLALVGTAAALIAGLGILGARLAATPSWSGASSLGVSQEELR